MAITIQLPDGQRREFKQDPIVIGRGPACQIRLTEESQLRDEHARIRKLAGRWLIESLGDWPIQAGEDASSRLSWLKVGDTIRLAQDGPELIFEPAHEDVALDSVTPGPRSTPPPLPGQRRASGSTPPPLPGEYPDR